MVSQKETTKKTTELLSYQLINSAELQLKKHILAHRIKHNVIKRTTKQSAADTHLRPRCTPWIQPAEDQNRSSYQWLSSLLQNRSATTHTIRPYLCMQVCFSQALWERWIDLHNQTVLCFFYVNCWAIGRFVVSVWRDLHVQCRDLENEQLGEKCAFKERHSHFLCASIIHVKSIKGRYDLGN